MAEVLTQPASGYGGLKNDDGCGRAGISNGDGNGTGHSSCEPVIFSSTIEALCFLARVPRWLISVRSLRSYFMSSWRTWRHYS